MWDGLGQSTWENFALWDFPPPILPITVRTHIPAVIKFICWADIMGYVVLLALTFTLRREQVMSISDATW